MACCHPYIFIHVYWAVGSVLYLHFISKINNYLHSISNSMSRMSWTNFPGNCFALMCIVHTYEKLEASWKLCRQFTVDLRLLSKINESLITFVYLFKYYSEITWTCTIGFGILTCLFTFFHFHGSLLTQFEPVFHSRKSQNYLQHIILYECQGDSNRLLEKSRANGWICNEPGNTRLPCNAIVAVWLKGSQVSRRNSFYSGRQLRTEKKAILISNTKK